MICINNYYIYKHITPDNKIYIGITKHDPESRWKDGKGYIGQWFYKAIDQFGWNNISHEILNTGLSELDAYRLETVYIRNIFHSYIPSIGYNDTLGGIYRVRCHPIRCIEKNVVFPYCSEMAQYLGFNYQSGISECYHKSIDSHGNVTPVLHKGFHFEAALSLKEGDVFPK